MSRHHWDSQGFSTERVDSVRGGLIAVGGGGARAEAWRAEWEGQGSAGRRRGRASPRAQLGEEGPETGARDQGLPWASGLAGAALGAGAGWAPHVWGVSLDKVAPPPNSNSRADPQGLPPVSA